MNPACQGMLWCSRAEWMQPLTKHVFRYADGGNVLVCLSVFKKYIYLQCLFRKCVANAPILTVEIEWSTERDCSSRCYNVGKILLKLALIKMKISHGCPFLHIFIHVYLIIIALTSTKTLFSSTVVLKYNCFYWKIYIILMVTLWCMVYIKTISD